MKLSLRVITGFFKVGAWKLRLVQGWERIWP